MRIARLAIIVVALGSSCVWAAKPCEELKGEIDAKLQAKGVKNYTLDVVASEDVKDQTVVGSCDGGRRKVVYKRESTPAK